MSEQMDAIEPVIEPTTEPEASADQEVNESPAAAEEKRRYKVKIEDEELEVDEDELLKGYQKSKASTKRFQEAARLKKEADELRAKLKESPFAALAGEMDPKQLREMTEQWLIEQLQEEALSPEEKELRDLRKFREEQEKLKEEVEEQRKAKELEAETQKEIERYNQEFVKSLEKHSLPRSYATIKRMAYLMKEAAENGYEMDPDSAAEIVSEELSGDFNQFVRTLDAEQLISFLGKDIADKIRKYDVSKVRNKTVQSEPAETRKPESKSSQIYRGPSGWKQIQAEIRKNAGI